jgi:hypothetical protein
MSEEKSDGIEILLEPKSEDYDPSDDRWMEQVGELYDGLQSEAGDVRKEVTAQEGQKGGFESVIMALGSAGALTAAVDVFRAWLARDRTRTVKLSIKVNDQIQEFEFSGSGMNKEQLNSFVEIAMNKLRKTDE